MESLKNIPDAELEERIRVAKGDIDRCLTGSRRGKRWLHSNLARVEKELAKREKRHVLFEGHADWPHVQNCPECLADVERRESQ